MSPTAQSRSSSTGTSPTIPVAPIAEENHLAPTSQTSRPTRRRNSADAISLVTQGAVSLHLPSPPSRRPVPGVSWKPSTLHCEPVEKPFDLTRAGTALDKLISRYHSTCLEDPPSKQTSYPFSDSPACCHPLSTKKQKLVNLARHVRAFVEQMSPDAIAFASGGMVDLLSMAVSALLPHTLVMVFLRDPETDELITSVPSGAHDANWENVVQLAVGHGSAALLPPGDPLLSPSRNSPPTVAHLRCPADSGFMGNLFSNMHFENGRVEMDNFPLARVAVDWLAENQGSGLFGSNSYIRRASQSENVLAGRQNRLQTPLTETLAFKSREFLDKLGVCRDDNLVMEETLLHILNINLDTCQAKLINEVSSNIPSAWPNFLPPLSSVPAVTSLSRLDGVPTRSTLTNNSRTPPGPDDSTEVGSSSRSGSPHANKERARKGLTRLSPVALLKFRAPRMIEDSDSMSLDESPRAKSMFGRRSTTSIMPAAKPDVPPSHQTLTRSANLLPPSANVPLIAVPLMGPKALELLPRQRMLENPRFVSGVPVGMIVVFPFSLVSRGAKSKKDVSADASLREALGKLLSVIAYQVQPIIHRTLHVALTLRDLRTSNLMLLFHRYVCKDLSNSENVIKRLLTLAEETTRTDISSLFVVDHLSSEFICHLGPTNCLGLRLGFTHPVLSVAFRTKRPVSFGMPTDVASLNSAFDRRSGVTSNIIMAVPLSTPDCDVKAVMVLINRKGRSINRRGTADYHPPIDTSRSTNSSTAATLMRLQTSRQYDCSPTFVPRQLSIDYGTSNRGAFLDGLEISDEYFSSQEEIILECIANEFANTCGSSLTRVTIRAILNTQQSRHAILHYMMPFEDSADVSPPTKLPRTPRRGSVVATLSEPYRWSPPPDRPTSRQRRQSEAMHPLRQLECEPLKTIEPLATPRVLTRLVGPLPRIIATETDEGAGEICEKEILLSRMLSLHTGETICSNTFRCPLTDTHWSKFGIKWWDYKLPELNAFWVEAICSLGASDLFSVERDTLSKFFLAVSDTYRVENPFHNFYHALQCFHATWMLLGVHEFSRFLYGIESFAVLVAALCHDSDHPGLNNAFVINANHPIALTYNDKSVLEMHHCATIFRMMHSNPASDIRATLTNENAKVFRRSFIVGVLGTDMQHHSKRLSLFADRVQKHSLEIDPFSCENDADREFIIEMSVHAADLSNPMMPDPYYKLWAALAIEEFNRQCDLETSIGMEVTAFMNVRTERPRTEMQLGFLEFVALPTWRTLAKLEQSLVTVINQGEDNSVYWRSRLAELEEAEKSKEVTPLGSNFGYSLNDFYFITDHTKRPDEASLVSWAQPH